jgi:hypothetical protein
VAGGNAQLFIIMFLRPEEYGGTKAH